MNMKNLVSEILSELEQHKASDIKVYDDKEFADFMIVTSCESGKHAKTLADLVVKIVKQNQITHHVEGYKQANWILIDLFSIMVHIFQPDVRQYYEVDKLWG